MKVICSYCEQDLGQKEPLESKWIAYALCNPCHRRLLAEWYNEGLGRAVEELQTPVVVFTQDARVVALNQSAADIVGRPPKDIFGLRGGEALDCKYAQLPERCGETRFCPICAIRGTIETVAETGQTLNHVPAVLNRVDRKLSFHVNAEKVGAVVMVSIDHLVDVTDACEAMLGKPE